MMRKEREIIRGGEGYRKDERRERDRWIEREEKTKERERERGEREGEGERGEGEIVLMMWRGKYKRGEREGEGERGEGEIVLMMWRGKYKRANVRKRKDGQRDMGREERKRLKRKR